MMHKRVRVYLYAKKNELNEISNKSFFELRHEWFNIFIRNQLKVNSEVNVKKELFSRVKLDAKLKVLHGCANFAMYKFLEILNVIRKWSDLIGERINKIKVCTMHFAPCFYVFITQEANSDKSASTLPISQSVIRTYYVRILLQPIRNACDLFRPEPSDQILSHSRSIFASTIKRDN